MNILVADDEVRIRENFIKRLGLLPLSINNFFQAKNGLEAINIIKNNPVDIALVDINMPLVNGLELLKHIHSSNPEIQTVIISGYDNFSFAQEAIKYGVKAYLLKPVNRKEFEEIILKLAQQVKISPETNFEEKIKQHILTNLSNSKYSLSDLAEEMSLSNGHLSKLILQKTDKSFVELMTYLRIKEAKKLLKELPFGTKIYEIAEMTGFSNQYYFSSVFKKEVGISPKEYLKNIHQIS